MPNLVLDEWIDLGVIGCRSITVTQRRTVGPVIGGNCEIVAIDEVPPGLLENLYADWNFDADATLFPSGFGPFELAKFGPSTIVDGHIKNALRIPTGSALIGVGLEDDFGFGDGQFTFHLWVNFESFPLLELNILQKASSGAGYILRVSNTGTLTWFIGNGSSYTSAVWGSALSLNTWYQIICGWDGSNVVLQVNTESTFGTPVTTALAAWMSNSQNFGLGNPEPPPGSSCTWLLDTLIAWSTFLDLTDRTNLWNNGVGVPGPSVGGGQAPIAIQGEPYTLTLTATGGTPPYTWSIVSGTLPTGVSFSSDGVFSGTPSDFGDFDLTVRVEDADGNFCELDITLTVANSVLDGVAAAWHFDSGGPFYTAAFGPYTFDSIGTMSIVSGKLSNAIRIEAAETLDGTSFQNALQFGSSFSLHCWIKFSTLPNGAQLYVDVLRKGIDAKGFILRVSDAGTVTFFTGDNNNYESVSWGSNLVTNTWYQIICGRDASNLYVQVNTESVLGTVVSAAVGSYVASNAPFYIPDDPPGTHTSDFLLDEVVLWSGKFLPLAERTFLWNSGVGRAYPFL